MNKEISSILKSVSKPGRYSGGEYGQIIKDKKEVKARFAFCFPDTYEIGMSNLGVRILYGVLNEEKEIIRAQIANDPKNANKPAQIIDKMVIGKIGKFYENNCLVDMEYFKEDKMSVGQYVAASEKELGGKIAIKSFCRYEKGEGIQKREENFAEEIEKLTKKA